MIFKVKKKLPPDVMEYFRKQGAKGGSTGGSKRYWENLTPEEKSERNRKAAASIPQEVRLARAKKAAAARKKKAQLTKKTKRKTT